MKRPFPDDDESRIISGEEFNKRYPNSNFLHLDIVIFGNIPMATINDGLTETDEIMIPFIDDNTLYFLAHEATNDVVPRIRIAKIPNDATVRIDSDDFYNYTNKIFIGPDIKVDFNNFNKNETNASIIKASRTLSCNDMQCVGFIYGGSVIDEKYVYFFKCNNGDILSYFNNNIVPYFGNDIKCRYVKCKKTKNIMQKLMSTVKDNMYQTHNGCNKILTCNIDCKFFVNCSIDEGTKLIKSVTNVESAYEFNIL